VDVGYLTPGHHLVVVESTGTRIVERAYRLLEDSRLFEFLSFQRPMEALGEVQVTIYLHRDGWRGPGEPLLARSPARFYRTRTSHILVGPTWRSLKKVHPLRGNDPIVLPTLTQGDVPPPPPDVMFPGRDAPFWVVIQDGTVKAVRAQGATVEVFATEQKEHSEVVLGKVRAVLEFPSVDAAAAFTRDFPRTEDPSSIDPQVTVDIDRSRKRHYGRKLIAGWVGLFAFFFAVILVPSVYFGIAAATAAGRVIIPSLGIGFMSLPFAMFYITRDKQLVEHRDLKEKWPRLALERYAEHAPGFAAAFVQIAREMGIPVNPELLDVKSLETYLRARPRETFFPPFAMGAAFYTGMVLLDSLGRDIGLKWRPHQERQDVVLWSEAIQLWVSPFSVVRQVWGASAGEGLDDFVRTLSEELALRYALSDVAGLHSLGFLKKGWDDIDDLVTRVPADAKAFPATTHVLNDNHFHRRAFSYGEFTLQVVHVELEGPSGPVQRPVVVLPFCTRTQAFRATLDGNAPKVPGRDDTVAVRLAGNELLAVGVQVFNYLEVANLLGSGEAVDLQLLAVSDEAQVVTPRMREMRKDAKDFLAPRDPGPEGLPSGPLASFVGRILEREELVNPFKDIPFWRVTLDISGFRLGVLVRKDKCDGLPDPGHFLSGSLWLLARLTPLRRQASAYFG